MTTTTTMDGGAQDNAPRLSIQGLVDVIKLQAQLNQGLTDSVLRLTANNEDAVKLLRETVATLGGGGGGAAAVDPDPHHPPHVLSASSSGICDGASRGGGDHLMHLLLVALLFAWFTVFFRPYLHTLRPGGGQ
jgi:hypothetical protein